MPLTHIRIPTILAKSITPVPKKTMESKVINAAFESLMAKATPGLGANVAA